MNTTAAPLPLDQYAAPGEAKAARYIVRVLLTHGFSLSVIDGIYGDGECTVKRSRDLDAIVAALATTGGDSLVIRDTDGNKVGTVVLIYGNAHDGSELMADYGGRDDVFMVLDRISDALA